MKGPSIVVVGLAMGIAIVIAVFIIATSLGIGEKKAAFTFEVTDEQTGADLSECAQAHFMKQGASYNEQTFSAGDDQLIHAKVGDGTYDVQFNCPSLYYPVHVNRIEVRVKNGDGKITYLDNDIGLDGDLIKVRLSKPD